MGNREYICKLRIKENYPYPVSELTPDMVYEAVNRLETFLNDWLAARDDDIQPGSAIDVQLESLKMR